MSWDKVVQKESSEDKKPKKVLRPKEGETHYMRVLDETPTHFRQCFFKRGNAGKGAFFPASKELLALVAKLNGEAGNNKENKVSDKFVINVLVYDAPVLDEKGKDTGKKADQVMVMEGGVKLFMPLRKMAESKQYGDLRGYNIELTRTGLVDYSVIADRQNSELEGAHAKMAKEDVYDLEEVINDVPPIEVQIDIAKGMTWADAWAKHKPKDGDESKDDGGEEEAIKSDGKKLSADDFDILD